MTVAELIEKLQECNPNREIMLPMVDGCAWKTPTQVLEDCDNIVYVS